MRSRRSIGGGQPLASTPVDLRRTSPGRPGPRPVRRPRPAHPRCRSAGTPPRRPRGVRTVRPHHSVGLTRRVREGDGGVGEELHAVPLHRVAGDGLHDAAGTFHDRRPRRGRTADAPGGQVPVPPARRHRDRGVAPGLDAQRRSRHDAGRRRRVAGDGSTGRAIVAAQRRDATGHHDHGGDRAGRRERRTSSACPAAPAERGRPARRRRGRRRRRSAARSSAAPRSQSSSWSSPNVTRSVASPRDTRERTLPSATPVSAAISAYSRRS